MDGRKTAPNSAKAAGYAAIPIPPTYLFCLDHVADVRSKSQSVTDNHRGMVGEVLLAVQNTGKVDLQSLKELKRLLGVHHFASDPKILMSPSCMTASPRTN